MGCSSSKLDNEEAVQLCKDRKKFIKEAVEHRMRFASGHIAYIKSLKRVSAALRDYIEGDDPCAFLLDSYITPPFTTTPIKKTSNNFISISPKSLSKPPLRSEARSTVRINYLRSGGNPSVAIQETVQPPQTVRVETYSPIHQYGTDGFFAMQSPPPMSSSFFSYSPTNRASFPPPSPQTSQWDFFWNPFSTLDFYGYPTRSSLDQTVLDDDVIGLRQVREEEGIPELEEETEQEESVKSFCTAKEKDNVDPNCDREEVFVEDTEDDDNETDSELDTEHDEVGSSSHGGQTIEVSKVQNEGHVAHHQETAAIADGENNKEKPGFTVYVQRRPTSMAEVMKDLDAQFLIVCRAASEVSAMLEASKPQYSSVCNELPAAKMLNPVALLRSASSRSTSSRFVTNTSSSKDEDYDSCSDLSEESCMLFGSHQTTLDRLYAWEKKLYQEVRAGERVRIAYEKKCAQLRNQDVKGIDSSSVDKTRVAIRDLHTQMKVSIHSVEAVSKRIETLRDEELQPQLLELVQGLARMWKVMADCHQVQKRTLDEAKLLLAGTPSKQPSMKKHGVMLPSSEPHQLARSAVNLEMELRNWQSCFRSWITSQQSYIHALSGWVLRCIRCDSDMSKLPFSPRRSAGTPQIFGLCIQWSRYLDGIQVDPVVEGLDFCAAGVGSLYAQQLREDSKRTPPVVGSKRFEMNMGVVEIGRQFEEEEEAMNAEKMAEVTVKVLCAGMSVAISSLAEFSVGSAQGYADLVMQWENGIQRKSGGTTAT